MCGQRPELSPEFTDHLGLPSRNDPSLRPMLYQNRAKPNCRQVTPFTNRASGVNWSSYSWEKGREFQNFQSMRCVHLPKGFYSPSGRAIVEHLVKKVVHGFLSSKKAFNSIPKRWSWHNFTASSLRFSSLGMPSRGTISPTLTICRSPIPENANQ